MEIQLKILPHQTNCLGAICKVFEGVQISTNNPIYQNPIINLDDKQIIENIDELWVGDIDGLNPIPMNMQRRIDDGILGIDAKLETGTGKTYIYTRLMYELHKRYGFNKFILLVPSTPIKEGTRNFIEAKYSKKHFADLYSNSTLKLAVLNAQKQQKSGRKMFPSSIAEFARGSRLERNRLNVLLMSDSMLLSKKTMEKDDYDQTLYGSFTQPYNALKETRPIVIIDEPHRFRRENKAYQCILEKLNPQCIIRFGATFPNVCKTNEKDYNNPVYNLGACEAFNESLVKGVAVQTLENTNEDDVKIKLMKIISKPKSCVFRNEKTKKSQTFVVGDYLSNIDENFSGITVEAIGKTDDPDIKNGVTLSNGHVLSGGDIIFASIYGATYQELMLKQAIQNHFKQEKANFIRGHKIKTLSLFFIDSIYSYRGDENDGTLRIKLEELLSEKLREEIGEIDSSATKNPNLQQYREFLDASLCDIKKTNGGYFAEDNSKADADIQDEVEEILRDKESLISFKDEYGNWNTRRFIFSKWTLREGWDNPNVFQITKLRSSGSEISKLQEVGRGLRLPVDEYGNRISTEQFYLTYLVDFSEKSFADYLVNEINADVHTTSIKEMLSKVAKERNISENILFAQLLTNEFVDRDLNIVPGKRDEMMNQFPEFNTGLQQGKVIDTTKGKNSTVKIRTKRFSELKELWSKINQKYYLKLDIVPEEELLNCVNDILDKDIYEKQMVYAKESRTEKGDNKIEIKEAIAGYHTLNDTMPYNEFLKRIHKATGLPLQMIHQGLVVKNKQKTLPKDFFNIATLYKFIEMFQEWLETAFMKRFSYQKLGVNSKETALTDLDGNVKDCIVQGAIGIMKDDSLTVPSKFLFDSFVYDSPKERETIEKSNIDEVVVFGKIPRKSIQVPLYFGGTTSPDFMYILKKRSGDYVVNFIVETKDVKKQSNLRGEEKMRIESAKVFFKAMRDDGLNISFEKQLKSDDIVRMIKKLVG
ncbi:type III restriction-modification system endonuclease [Acetobacterium paludosum]|uniref:Type III restriction-modification system endonuclease n=1 Tax=Acetobacterium paludosum TaxID=52693 RepID=A0A923I0R7_9FIRM|nr:type III restriction-modification system endonuclease [Acetobacterium paludosum]MBC3887983.1 type III restriction-modification system endonuclease [Acetobacterium paludosum]